MQSFEIVAERPLVEARLEFFLPVGKSPYRIEFAKLMSEPPPGEFPPGKDNRGQVYFQNRSQRLLGARSQPVFEVRPSDLVSATSGHNSDMASGGAKQFFIFAAHLGQDRF